MNACILVCDCVRGVYIFEVSWCTSSIVSIVCVLPVWLHVCRYVWGICVSSVLLGFTALWLFWRSEMTPWERGQSSLPPHHLLLSPSLHLSFHVFSSLSCVALGMWTLLNFPPGGWRRRQEGIRGVIPSLLLSSVSPLSFPWGDSGRWVHTVKR